MDLLNKISNSNESFAVIARILSTAIYFFIVAITLRDYASVYWGEYRIYYDAIGTLDVLVAIIFVITVAIFVPSRLSSPSSLILIFCYLFIIIPAGVCLLAIDGTNVQNRYFTLSIILISFSVSCKVTRSSEDIVASNKLRMPKSILGPILVVLAFISLIFLYIRFGSIMSFATLDNLYEQRALGAADNFLEGYAQTYSQYVFSTGLFALGLYQKNFIYIVLGLIGSVTNYAITAEKAGVMYPIFIISLYFMTKAKNSLYLSVNFIMFTLSLILVISIYSVEYSGVSEFISWYLGTRTILTPGLFVAHYSDFFVERGYTIFSHIRGLNLVIPAPNEYMNDPRWPQIGLIVGEDYIGVAKLNANANFIASDGIASLGIMGIIVSFAILTVIIKVFDYLGRGIPMELQLTILLSIALSLTNGSALSAMASTGGFFWMVAFRFLFAPVDKGHEISLGRMR